MRNLLVTGVLAVAACSPQSREPNQPSAVGQKSLDPFVVMIGAERWTVMLDRAPHGT